MTEKRKPDEVVVLRVLLAEWKLRAWAWTVTYSIIAGVVGFALGMAWGGGQ